MKIKDIWNRVKESLKNSTSHGIPKIFESNNWTLRLVWICSTIISTAFCAYLITRNIVNYYDFEVSTKIRTTYQYKSIFPSVTICNFNPFTNESTINILNVNSTKSMTDYRLLVQKAIRMGKIREMGDSVEKLIIQANFNQKNLDINSGTFTYHLNPSFGNCYTFNNHKYENGSMKEPIINDKIGRFNGLSLVLNFTVSKKLDDLNQEIARGGVLFIHECGCLPFTEDSIFISPDYMTKIGLQRTLSIQKPIPYSKCEFDKSQTSEIKSQLYKEIRKRSIRYTQNLCFKYCELKYIIEKCSCYVHDFFAFPEYIPCVNETEMKCASYYLKNFNDENLFFSFCLPNCPLECENTVFTKTISTISIQTEKIKNNNYDNIAYFSVNYEDYTITEITESEVIDTITLISNIGGIAGLFLGISFLTIIESIAITVEVFKIILKKNKKNNLDRPDLYQSEIKNVPKSLLQVQARL